MRVLVSEKLSEHKYKTPEGYLICTDAILARTGKQSYTKDELFQDGDNAEVDVDRPYDEVMNVKTIASFENKPITFDHPDEDVNVGNYKNYAIGYVRDVHQGKVNGQDVILGNLVITDQDAIDAVESGEHTDLSCGYDCDIKDDNGNYFQSNIRGNHVALCKEGRAGMARIVDSKIKDTDLIAGKTYTSNSGNKLTINKVYASYSDFNGEPWTEIDYSFVTTDGRKGRSKCSTKDFFMMMHDAKQKTKYVDSKVDDDDEPQSLDEAITVVSKKFGKKARAVYDLQHTGSYIIYVDSKRVARYYLGRHRMLSFMQDSIKDDDEDFAEEYDTKATSSKEMTMSDAVKMLEIVDAYKKVKDGYKDR